MQAGLDACERGRAVFGCRDNIYVATFQIIDEGRRVLDAEDRKIQRLLDVRQGALNRKIDYKGEQQRTEQRAHEQGRRERATIAKVIENLFAKNREYRSDHSGVTR